jgi:hypothetical protein
MADNTVYVVAHPKQGERVALHSFNAGPDNSEVFVAGQESAPVEVQRDHPDVAAARASRAPGQDPRIVVLEGEALAARQKLYDAAAERRAAVREATLAAANPNARPGAGARADKATEQADKAAQDAEAAAAKANADRILADAKAEAERLLTEARAEAAALKAQNPRVGR